MSEMLENMLAKEVETVQYLSGRIRELEVERDQALSEAARQAIEVGRLREAIENSPCPDGELALERGQIWVECENCDCWKRKALEGE